jgi:hypothetical protein
MDNELLEKLLKGLPEQCIEKARLSLAEEIKNQIPPRLAPHKADTINIMVDLRISRLAAAAAIAATILLISLVGLRGFPGSQTIQDGKMFLKYCLGGEKAYKADVLASLIKLREELIQQGKEVVYYGNSPDPADKYAVVMHWKLPDGRYTVVFGDFTAKTVSPDTLIKLQSQMLRERTK